jgi:hypothetical protein
MSSDFAAGYGGEIWRPRRDLNPCYRRERPVSWAELDDGDVLVSRAGLEPANPLLKSFSRGQLDYPTVLEFVDFSTHTASVNDHGLTRFGDSSQTKRGQSKCEKSPGDCFSENLFYFAFLKVESGLASPERNNRSKPSNQSVPF